MGIFGVSSDPRDKGRLRKSGGSVVSYLCTPDREVLHWLVGPVDAETLSAAIEWVIDWHRELQDEGSLTPESRKARVAEIHRERMMPETQYAVRQTVAVRFGEPELTREISKPEAAELVKAARRITSAARGRIGQLRRRFDATTIAGRRRLQTCWKKMEAIEDDLVHIVLARAPLVLLGDVERPAFEILARQRYAPRSRRNDQLLAAVRGALARRRPVLLVVTDARDTTAHASEPTSLMPKHRGLRRQLDKFTVMPLTRRELVRLTDDLNQRPMEHPHRSRPRYIVLDGSGNRVGFVVEGRSGARTWFRSWRPQELTFSPKHRYAGIPLAAAMKQAWAAP